MVSLSTAVTVQRMADPLDAHLFAEAAELVRSMAPDGLGDLRYRTHRRGLKIWFGPETPTREHYEAQLLARRHVGGGDGVVLEVGFHAEHPDEAKNQAVADRLARRPSSGERSWGRQRSSMCSMDATPGVV